MLDFADLDRAKVLKIKIVEKIIDNRFGLEVDW
jgi:hypothetical protein